MQIIGRLKKKIGVQILNKLTYTHEFASIPLYQGQRQDSFHHESQSHRR